MLWFSFLLVLLDHLRFPLMQETDLAQVFADPQIVERAMVIALEHPIAGTIRALGVPVKLADTPGAIRQPPPMLGQHTNPVLRDLGIENEEIARLKEEGAI